MKKKILMTLTILVLVLLPFLLSSAIGKYSPYVEPNSFERYVLIWAAVSILIFSLLMLAFRYFHQSFKKISGGGVLLFLLLSPLVGIYGLMSAPDLSLKMLAHPEREHLRYGLLFLALILFGAFVFLLFKSNLSKINRSIRWILAAIFIFAFAEYIWEFTHHYLFPEALKEWVGQGNNAEDFGKNYDNFNLITIGVFGRYFQFTCIIWLSLYLYKLQQIKFWSVIINITFSILAIVSATIILITKMKLPSGFEFLFLLFIPGIPFFLLYWLGVALVTKRKSSI